MILQRSTVMLLFFLSSTLFVVSKADPGCLKCRKYDNKKINVHLVPHSHDDVGWLKTLDQYYYGLETGIQDASVQYIITTVLNALENNPERRYIQVETAYFWTWWKDQTEIRRQKFVNLVNNGQIEMVNGAWAMNDEACVNYQSTIDQFTWGLRLINETIGKCGIPRVGWQIDPFGHSKEQANIFAQLGYDGVIFARLDHDDKDQRHSAKNLDFAWQGNADLENRIIFGSILQTALYSEPDGFCFDALCQDEPIVDNPESPAYNLESRVYDFAAVIRQYAEFSTTNHILIAMGGDFQYSNAEKNFINMDRLIKGFQNDSNIDVFYSTPSCYIKAVNEVGPVLKLKTDDFFPYSDDPNNFWAGYFSSRPTNKRFERIGHNILQVTKQLYALHSHRFSRKYEDHLTRLREAMGTLQHHDAITGTEKQEVSYDYIRLLSQGIADAEQPLGDIIKDLIGMDNITLELKSCLLSNVSICTTSQNFDKFLVFVYNPLAWNVTHYVRLPVETENFIIHGPDGVEPYDVLTPISHFSFMKTKQRPAKHDLVFTARNLPGMGSKMYYVEKVAKVHRKRTVEKPKEPKYKFGNNISGFEIYPKTNFLKSVTLNGKTVSITQNFYYYESGNNTIESPVASGAYIFRPDFNGSFVIPTSSPNDTVVSKYQFSGNLVDEFHQIWNSPIMNAKQVIRVYKNEGYIEFDWLVGNLNVSSYTVSREIISKFTVTEEFNNRNEFYTDSNGREPMKRTLNSRPDYDYDASNEPVASNYYPVTSKITIQDNSKDLRITVLNDRSQGGSSLNNGEIELMLHRRLVHDDNKGVNENLDEVEYDNGLFVRGSHYLIIGRTNGVNPDGLLTITAESYQVQQKLLQPWIGVSGTDRPYSDMEQYVKENIAAVNGEILPHHVNVLTFEPWTGDSYLLRLDYHLETTLTMVVQTVDLKKLFKDIEIKTVTETTLGANQYLDDYKKQEKYQWKLNKSANPKAIRTEDSEWIIRMYPMEIRTFIVTFYKNK